MYWNDTFNLKTSALTEKIVNYEYHPVEFTMFSNMEDTFDIEVSSPEHLKDDDLREFYHLKCPKISFSDTFSLNVASEYTDLDHINDLSTIRNIAYKLNKTNEYPLLQHAFPENEDGSKEYILENKWFKFCTAPVWMDRYGVYIALNRVVYCHDPVKLFKRPKISLLYAQIFDKEWNELLNYTMNDIHGDSIVFPTILPIQTDDWDDDSLYIGPEDPRVTIRDYFNNVTQKMEQEPVIIYNSMVKNLQKARSMHIYRPLTDRTKGTRLEIQNAPIKMLEKNWSPFFGTDKNYIYLLYGLLPFRILKCDIINGHCFTVTGPKIDPKEKVRDLSGSTNLVEIPSNLLPSDLRDYRKYWFGIVRSHIFHCGCLQALYRFHGILISTSVKEQNEVFTVDYLTSLLDFNIDPEPWNNELKDHKCSDEKSVLIPNSIAYWDIIPSSMSNGKNNVGEDIMGISYSEADKFNRVIHVKGWLAHLLTVLGGNKHKYRKHYLRESKNILESDFISECAVSEAKEYCLDSEKKYGWIPQPKFE